MRGRASCAYCEGPLVYLGALGRMHWYRCRNCGAEYSSLIDPPEFDDAQEEGASDDD